MTYAQAREAFERLFEGAMTPDEARTFLIELYRRGENAQEIAAAASVMREHALALPIDEALRAQLIDNCGTGGDKSGSFNISTTASLLLVACGCKVAKHGNRSVTSRSGSADMLEALGIRLDLDIAGQIEMLKATGFCFLFAINHHPAMKHIMPIRKSLSHRTIFNLLGPLSNPAGVRRQLIGVFDAKFVPLVAEALKELGSESAMVVGSYEGLDEISLERPTRFAWLKRGEIIEGEIDPSALGVKPAPLEALRGGDAAMNALITSQLLQNRLQGPMRDVVLLNAAAALMVDGKAADWREGIGMAQEAIESGAAAATLERLLAWSQAQ